MLPRFMDADDRNPYAAPVAEALPGIVPIGELPAGPYGPFRDNRVLSRWLIGLLVAGGVFHICRATFNLVYLLFPVLGEADIFRKFEWGLAIFGMANLACLVVFGTWIVRAGKNAWLFARLRRPSASGPLPTFPPRSLPVTPEDTPGWAVGWYFVPIANLWKPYGAMKDIVKASTLRQPVASWLLPIWWTLWIASIFSENIVQFSGGLGDRAEPLVAVVLWSSSSAIDVALHLVAIVLVRTVTAMQTDTAAELSGGNSLG